jgi:hypothetical protein
VSDTFHIQNGLKQDALTPLHFRFSLEYAIRKSQEYQDMLESNWKHQLLVYTDYVTSMGINTNSIKKNTGTSLDAFKV